MNPHSATFRGTQCLQVSQSLGIGQHGEGVRLSWNGYILSVICGELQEQSGGGAALVKLPGGVEKARAVPQSGRDVVLLQEPAAESVQGAVNFRRTPSDGGVGVPRDFAD